MMTNVLSDNTDRIPEFYDCNVLQLYANSQQDCWNGNRGVVRPAAAKTGTTNDFRDNWTVGYTTDFVMGVWAGNDDNSPMIDVSGITGAAPIWHDSMLVAEQGHPIQDFVNPGGFERATVTYPDGVQTTDLFLPGTVPTFAETPTPAPTSGNGDTPTPEPVGNPSQPLPTAYCPASYSFVFPPPDNGGAVDAGWW
jgi:membrane peptidoglycan carboxypeptidase